LSPDDERQQGLTRERLVGAALDLIGEEGLEGLSMRALADRLQVKAASLYWPSRSWTRSGRPGAILSGGRLCSTQLQR